MAITIIPLSQILKSNIAIAIHDEVPYNSIYQHTKFIITDHQDVYQYVAATEAEEYYILLEKISENSRQRRPEFLTEFNRRILTIEEYQDIVNQLGL